MAEPFDFVSHDWSIEPVVNASCEEWWSCIGCAEWEHCPRRQARCSALPKVRCARWRGGWEKYRGACRGCPAALNPKYLETHR